MLSVESQHKIQELLVAGNLLSQQQLADAEIAAAKESKPLIAYIAANNLVSEEDLTRVSAQAMGVPYANLAEVTIPSEVSQMISKETAETYMAVPFGMMNGQLAVGMLDPTNIQAVDFLGRKLGQTISVFLVSRASIDHTLAQLHNNVAADVAADLAVESVDDHPKVAGKAGLENLVQDAPITR